MSILKRRSFEALLKHLTRKDYILITGPRQTGKTTLLKQLGEHLRNEKQENYYVTFEDPGILKAVNDHPENIFFYTGRKEKKSDDGHKTFLLVDEVQLAADPSNFLKLLYDQHGDWLKIVATGSSAFYLDEKFKDSLAGRKRIVELYPLDFPEYLEFTGYPELRAEYHQMSEDPFYRSLHAGMIRQLFGEYLTFGGYPAVVLEKDPAEKREILRDLVRTYLKRDVFDAHDSDYLKVVQLLKALAFQTGQLVNINELSRTLKYTMPTIQSYLYILQKCYHIHLLKPFFMNIRNELTRMPKVFFHDNGFRNAVMDLWEPVTNRPDRGTVIENATFIRLREEYGQDNLRFWRTASKNEIDFLILEGLSPKLALEVKYNGAGWRQTAQKLFQKNYPDAELKLIAYETDDPRQELLRLVHCPPATAPTP